MVYLREKEAAWALVNWNNGVHGYPKTKYYNWEYNTEPLYPLAVTYTL